MSTTSNRSSPLSYGQSTPDFLANFYKTVENKSHTTQDRGGTSKKNPHDNGGIHVMMQGILAIHFIVQALGLSFSIINAIYLSTIDKDCPGYNKEESQFLFAMSIIFCVFFGIGTISSVSFFIQSF